MVSKWRHDVTWKSGCFPAPERGDISKNSGILPVRGKGDFCATDGLVGLARKERNYDCFDDQRYNEVDDVEVLAHNVCFVLLQGI